MLAGEVLRRQLRFKAGEYSASLSESHVLPPVDSHHAAVVFLVRVCPMHEQVLDDVGLVVVGGVEEAGPTGLPGSQVEIKRYYSVFQRSFRDKRVTAGAHIFGRTF